MKREGKGGGGPRGLQGLLDMTIEASSSETKGQVESQGSCTGLPNNPLYDPFLHGAPESFREDLQCHGKLDAELQRKYGLSEDQAVLFQERLSWLQKLGKFLRDSLEKGRTGSQESYHPS